MSVWYLKSKIDLDGEKMPEIEIRAVNQDDLTPMIELDHSYKTDHMLQMQMNSDETNLGVNFRKVRLPRLSTIQYPRTEEELVKSWELSSSIFVGIIKNEFVAYIGMEEIPSSSLVRVRDIVVAPNYRRLGIASGLILAAEKWASSRKFSMMILEMQPKNNPAINLAKKLGYSFSGFQNRYFPNQEMAIFFEKYIS